MFGLQPLEKQFTKETQKDPSNSTWNLIGSKGISFPDGSRFGVSRNPIAVASLRHLRVDGMSGHVFTPTRSVGLF